MLAALLTLLLVNLAVRGIAWIVRSFVCWLDEGPQLQRLVDKGILSEDKIESKDAAQIRAFIKDSNEWRRESRLGHKVRDDRPRLTQSQRSMLRKAEGEARKQYLSTMHLEWYHIVTIFLVASILGLVIEEVFCFVVNGVTESRVGLVWGPFSPLYGTGAVLLTLICWGLERRGAPWWVIFVVGMVVGGLLEQVTGWGMEHFLGVSSWDYTGYPGALSKWVCVPFLFFWGALGLVWDKVIMPSTLYHIGMPSTLRQFVFVAILALYLGFDIFMTVNCFGRMARRDAGIPPHGPFEEWVDEHYSDSFIAARFQNMVFDSEDTQGTAGTDAHKTGTQAADEGTAGSGEDVESSGSAVTSGDSNEDSASEDAPEAAAA